MAKEQALKSEMLDEFGLMWLCPSVTCADDSRYKKGDRCRTCGQQSQDFGVMASFSLIEAKKKNKKKEIAGTGVSQGKVMVFRPERKAEPYSTSTAELESSQSSIDKRSANYSLEELLIQICEQNKTLLQQNRVIIEALSRKKEEVLT